MKRGQKLLKAFCLLLIAFFAVQILVPAGDGFVTTAEAGEKVALNMKKATIYNGETLQLELKGTTEKVTWSSSKKSVATVSKKGLVTAKKAGKTTITAKVGKKKYTCKVTVLSPISVGKTEVILDPEKTGNVGVQFYLKDLSWLYFENSNPSVARVDWYTSSKKLLEIKALTPGSTTITVRNKKTKDNAKINVKVLYPLSLNVESADLECGKNTEIIALCSDQDLVCESSDTNIFTVERGSIIDDHSLYLILKPVNEGNATLTVKAPNREETASIPISVTDPNFSITCPQTPFEIHHMNLNGTEFIPGGHMHCYNITDLRVKFSSTEGIYQAKISVAGVKTTDRFGGKNRTRVSVIWSLVDANGATIQEGTAQGPVAIRDEPWRLDDFSFDITGLPAGHYTLKIENTVNYW